MYIKILQSLTGKYVVVCDDNPIGTKSDLYILSPWLDKRVPYLLGVFKTMLYNRRLQHLHLYWWELRLDPTSGKVETKYRRLDARDHNWSFFTTLSVAQTKMLLTGEVLPDVEDQSRKLQGDIRYVRRGGNIRVPLH